MKKLSYNVVYRSLLVFLLTFIMQVAVFGQENPAPSGGSSSGNASTTTATTTTTTTWYMQPWAWVLGGAILLLLIIALVRGGSRDREVTRTTVIKSDKDYR